MLTAGQPSQHVIPSATPYLDLAYHTGQSQSSLAMGLAWMSKETHKRGKISSCSNLEGFKEIPIIQVIIQVLPTAFYGGHILIFTAYRYPHGVRGKRQRKQFLEKEKDQELGMFSFWQQQMRDSVYLLFRIGCLPFWNEHSVLTA